MSTFSELGLRAEVCAALASYGFEAPTDIQALAMPSILDGRDAYMSSATGTGKTLAYLAPAYSRLDPTLQRVQLVVAAPTHDLASQLAREAERLAEASGLGIRVARALGSMPIARQLERLADKPHVVVGSMGRLRDLVTSGHLAPADLRWAVLDEGDRLFEKESIDITGQFLAALPDTCSRVLVSATIPERTVERSSPWFRDAARLALDSSESLRTSIEHWCFHAPSRSKIEFLRRFEAAVKPERCLLFASSNAAIFAIVRKLEHLGFPMAVLKSDRDSQNRKSALESFSSGEVRWLVTTDLGARGLDIADVSHVISFDLPEDPTVYVHRAGRTGRAGCRGVSVAVADLVELKRASKIATRYGFSFICKIMESGRVHDIEPENFFAVAEEEEAARKNVKLEASRKPDRQGQRPRQTRTSAASGRTRPVGQAPRQDAPRPRRDRQAAEPGASRGNRAPGERPRHDAHGSGEQGRRHDSQARSVRKQPDAGPDSKKRPHARRRGANGKKPGAGTAN
ncbi:MAG: DEAD/DEAH box helicase [Spirochaetales bacterium]|nr:DEAD/DEAH box helicase [Spirochaetales bacterium]